MNEYKRIKEELKKRRESVNGFTPDFFKDFSEANAAAETAILSGTFEKYSYTKNGVILSHIYDKVYNSDFYRNNGGSYCEFLSIFLDICETEYKFIFAIPGGQVTKRRYFTTRAHAEKYAAYIMQKNNYYSFEVATA